MLRTSSENSTEAMSIAKKYSYVLVVYPNDVRKFTAIAPGKKDYVAGNFTFKDKIVVRK